MRRFGAVIALGLALVCGRAEAAIAIIAGTGTGGAQGQVAFTGATTSVFIATTSDIPAGSFAYVSGAQRSALTWSSAIDSAGNTYAAGQATFGASSPVIRAFYSYTTIDLPAPCTVTATETTTTLVVTATVTCSGTDALTVGQAISGGSFTGQISAPCLLVAGAATCTITGGATVATPGTATISSTITMNKTVTGNGSVIAAAFSGMAGTSFSAASTTATGSATGAISIGPTGTLVNPTLLLATVSFFSASGLTEDAAWTNLGVQTNAGLHMGFKVVTATTPVTYAPSLTGTSGTWNSQLQAFNAPASAACQPRNLLGVGC